MCSSFLLGTVLGAKAYGTWGLSGEHPVFTARLISKPCCALARALSSVSGRGDRQAARGSARREQRPGGRDPLTSVPGAVAPGVRPARALERPVPTAGAGRTESSSKRYPFTAVWPCTTLLTSPGLWLHIRKGGIRIVPASNSSWKDKMRKRVPGTEGEQKGQSSVGTEVSPALSLSQKVRSEGTAPLRWHAMCPHRQKQPLTFSPQSTEPSLQPPSWACLSTVSRVFFISWAWSKPHFLNYNISS